MEPNTIQTFKSPRWVALYISLGMMPTMRCSAYEAKQRTCRKPTVSLKSAHAPTHSAKLTFSLLSVRSILDMKKLTLLILAVVVAVAAFYVAEGFMDAMLQGGKSASSPRGLAQISRQMNVGLPQQLDKETRFDGTMAGPGNRFTYLYTLVNLSEADIDVADFAAKMKPVLVNGYKTLPAMKALREARVELHYQYHDKDSNEVATIIVSPKDF